MKKLILITIPLLFSGVAHAQSSQLDIDEPCQDIIIRLDSVDERHIQEVAIYNFFMGYSFGAGAASTGKYADKSYVGLSDGIKSDFIFSYVRNYCLHTPNGELADAVIHLLYDIRTSK